MPHINRIRVNNVKYNFGTQFYDDFSMRFDGKNALYDLANGGGKSVLMLLLFQNLIPNCTLDEKQPVEKLFRTSDGSTSIHSLVEWKLDDIDIEDGYKYMLTGFCARKAKNDDNQDEPQRASAAIDYFNYCIFYRSYNDNDIINLPLSKGNEHMTYTGLRTYLKTLEHSDYQLKVYLFDRKGEYQRFISRYGLYESQWEIIRGINKTEGHVRTYFESNYRTTRRVIEDLLIEEIIQKAFITKAGGDDSDMAQTLLSIKDRLLELSKKRDELADYDGQIEALKTFGGRIESLKTFYAEEDAYKKELVKIINTMKQGLRSRQRDIDLLSKENSIYEKRILETKRRLDTAKVQKNRERLKTMESDGAADKENLNRLEMTYSQKLYELAKAQSMNDYMEYRENEKEIRIIREALENSAASHGHIVEDMHRLSAQAKRLIDSGRSVLSKKAEETRKHLKNCGENTVTAETGIREADRQAAVLEFDIENGRQREKEFQKILADLRGELGVLMADGTQDELEMYRKAHRQVQEKAEALKNEADEARKALEVCIRNLNQAEADKKIFDARKLQIKTFFNEHEQLNAIVGRLAEIYGASGSEKLKTVITQRFKNAAADICVHNERKTALETYLGQLDENNPAAVPRAVTEIVENLRRSNHIKCMCGSEYLKAADEERRGEVLERLPFLPYAVIVSEGFASLAGDTHFLEKYFADFTTPIVSMQTVESGENICGGILFTGDKRRLYVDEKAVSEEKEKIQKQISEEASALKRLLDQQETYLADLEQVHYFMNRYEKVYAQKLSELDALERRNLDEQKAAEAMKTEIERLTLCIEAAHQAEDRMREEEKEAAYKCTVSEKMIEVRSELTEAVGRRKENEAALEKLHEARAALKTQLETLKIQSADVKGQLKGLETDMETLRLMWEKDFFAYYESGADTHTPDNPKQVFDREELEAIHVRFMGMKQVCEAGNGELTDKRRLLENCEKTAARLRAAIEGRNISFESLEAMAQTSKLSYAEEAKLIRLKAEAKQLEAEIKLHQAMAADRLASRHQLLGSVENAIQVIEERYGSYEEIDLRDKDYDVFLAEYRQLLEGLAQKNEASKEALDKAQRQFRSLEEMQKEMLRLARMSGASLTLTDESYMPDMNFRRKSEEMQYKYEQLRKNEDFKKAEFEKGRDKLIESLNQYHAAELSAEVRSHIKLPSQLFEAEQMLSDAGETIRIIMLEKERVLTGIDSMVKMKENFVRQCVQRCTDIKMEIERLPEMSKITLAGEAIQMLKLKIPYVKEEYYEQRMADYVDNIAKMSDRYSDGAERLKYIRSKLAWKQLFQVIVSDMNAIRLSLYKRERIREQSRFLRYEEAVGSTGQSQGIYIQFLIAIINYISAINSKSTETAALKKVIFIDNPFGAAKDIYIWEPIFELLRENHVQLIVPARGATPAITGKFDVNYILGQKLAGNRQQTVVVDFYSNIAVEEVEYRRIEFEQQVFDFV